MARETILILDGEFHTQWTLKTLLESENYVVVAVGTCEGVLRSFSEFEVSGLITEYWVGRSTCLEMLRELKKRFPWLYVMMLTDADVVESEYEDIIHAGVDDFFLKPVSSTKLLLHLKKGLKQRSTLLERIRLEQELNRAIRARTPEGIDALAVRPVAD